MYIMRYKKSVEERSKKQMFSLLGPWQGRKRRKGKERREKGRKGAWNRQNWEIFLERGHKERWHKSRQKDEKE